MIKLMKLLGLSRLIEHKIYTIDVYSYPREPNILADVFSCEFANYFSILVSIFKIIFIHDYTLVN